jgi:hypothetical protein
MGRNERERARFQEIFDVASKDAERSCRRGDDGLLIGPVTSLFYGTPPIGVATVPHRFAKILEGLGEDSDKASINRLLRLWRDEGWIKADDGRHLTTRVRFPAWSPKRTFAVIMLGEVAE